MDSSLVSVIITTYNRATYIEQTIESIQNQTYGNIEILVIDDGSLKSTAHLVESICNTFSKCTYFWKPNSGQPDSRNYGIKRAKGTYIGFCDDDDFWVLNKVEKQIKVLIENPDFDIVTGCISYFGTHVSLDEKVKCHNGYNHGYIFENLLIKNRTDSITPLLRKKVFIKTGYFDPSFTISEDWDFWRKAAYYHKFYAIHEVLAYVRKHDSNMTFLANKDLTDRILMHRKVTKSLLKWGKIRFSNSEKQKIRYFEFNEYKRLITNHYSSILAKCYCLLTLFKKAPLTTFYVLFLFIIFKNGKKVKYKTL